MEIIQTIALLCNLYTGADGISLIEVVKKSQLECQQYYIKCLDPLNTNYKTLSKCIRERK
jgi:hypothetical protein